MQLAVTRNLENRRSGDMSDQSPMALELHRLRSKFLHAAFANQVLFQVENWGETDDKESHELVILTIVAASGPVLQNLAWPLFKSIAEKLLGKLGDSTAEQLTAWLLAKLGITQHVHTIEDFSITLSDGRWISVRIPKQRGEVSVICPGKETIRVCIHGE